ncbi:hypothetical protein [Citrobacter koseri]|uniref:hypothetical protein n=1 Tax=Citrobacter koseri TaxID=545 RepID=UPI0024B83327|nr:hypothetical protein [Citrobacter koseri]MDI9801760.1 hypothetical protein [Citrobacter koseri]
MVVPTHEFLTGLALKTALSYVIATLDDDQKQVLIKLAETRSMNFDKIESDSTSKEELSAAAKTVNDLVEEIIKTGCGQS